MIAVLALPFFEAQARERMSLGGQGVAILPTLDDGRSRDYVAKIFAISPRYVQYAKAIRDWDNEVFTAVAHGDTTNFFHPSRTAAPCLVNTG